MNVNGLSVSELKSMTPTDLMLLRDMVQEAAKDHLLQEQVSRIEAWEARNPQYLRLEVVEDWNSKRFHYHNGLVLVANTSDPMSYEMALDMESPYDTHAWHDDSDDIEDGLDGFKRYLLRQKNRAQRELARFEDMCRRMGVSDE